MAKNSLLLLLAAFYLYFLKNPIDCQYIVYMNVKDSSRNAQQDYCALKKTNNQEMFNGISYNFTYYLPPFTGCFTYYNLTTIMFKINGTISYNSSLATIYFFNTNQTFLFSNDTLFSLSDQTTVSLSFNDTNAIIQFVQYNQSIYFNNTNTSFSQDIVITQYPIPTVAMAVFLPIHIKCSLKKIVYNVGASITQIVIFGGNGPFVSQ